MRGSVHKAQEQAVCTDQGYQIGEWKVGDRVVDRNKTGSNRVGTQRYFPLISKVEKLTV